MRTEISPIKVVYRSIRHNFMVKQFNSGSERAHSHPTHIDCLLVVIDSRTLDTACPWNLKIEITVCSRMRDILWCLDMNLGYFEDKLMLKQFGNVRSCRHSTPAPFSCHLRGPNSRNSTEFDFIIHSCFALRGQGRTMIGRLSLRN